MRTEGLQARFILPNMFRPVTIKSILLASISVAGIASLSNVAHAQRYSPIIQRQQAPIIKRAQPAPIIQARSVPWAASVYQPTSDESDYGKRSLANIDAYLASQCKRSGNRQYYCTNKPLSYSQLEWINRATGVQMQQTHYRCGSDSWCVR